MRILRGRDFYDSALAYGADKETVFVRDGLILKDEKAFKAKYGESLSTASAPFAVRPDKGAGHPRPRRLYLHHGEIYLQRRGVTIEAEYSEITVFLAGKRYHGIEVYEKSSNHWGEFHHTFWDAETFRQYVESLDHKLVKTRWALNPEMANQQTVEQFFNPDTTERDYDFLVKNRISILTHSRHDGYKDQHWTVNGDNLKELGFAKKVDPYQCFQELSMYVGGVIPKDGPPMVEITDDKIKAEKHGMDKWSFRRTNAHKPNS